jgi:hypothetical protein
MVYIRFDLLPLELVTTPWMAPGSRLLDCPGTLSGGYGVVFLVAVEEVDGDKGLIIMSHQK